MGRVLFPTKKGYQMGVSISFNPYEVDENRVLSSINKTTELIERSSTFHTNFRIGSVIMREKKDRADTISLWLQLGFESGS